jgi:hypothetical protein
MKLVRMNDLSTFYVYELAIVGLQKLFIEQTILEQNVLEQNALGQEAKFLENDSKWVESISEI